MLNLFSESWRAVGRMRWFLLAAMIALPASQIPSEIGRYLLRKRIENQRPGGFQSPPARRKFAAGREWHRAIRDGVSEAASLYRNLAMGEAAWLAAVLVVVRPRCVWRWLGERAGLRQGRGAIFGFLLAGAVVTVFVPLLLAVQTTLINFSREWGAWVVLIGHCVLWMLAIWFGACLMAFLQCALYPLFVRAWAGQSVRPGDMLNTSVAGWVRLVRFNFWVGSLGQVLQFGPSLLLGFRWFRERSHGTEQTLGFLVTLGWLAPVLFLALVFVPFAVVMRDMRLGRAVGLSAAAVVRHPLPLIGLLLPLAVWFSMFSAVWQFLRVGGNIALLSNVGTILIWIPFAFVATVGLVAGAGLFDRLILVNNPDTRS